MSKLSKLSSYGNAKGLIDRIIELYSLIDDSNNVDEDFIINSLEGHGILFAKAQIEYITANWLRGQWNGLE